MASPFDGKVLVGAKVDYITLVMPLNLKAKPNFLRILEKLKMAGRLEIPRARMGVIATIHDPTVKELSALVSAHPACRVEALEVSVDFKPTSAVPRAATNTQTYQFLRHNLDPAKLPRFAGCRRTIYDASKRKMRRDRLGDRLTTGTLYWKEQTRYTQMRMYLKEKDHKVTLKAPFVRIELTFYRGGCQAANVSSLAGLPKFFKTVRVKFGAAFNVASGVKFNPTPSRAKAAGAGLSAADQKQAKKLDAGFTKYGAMWCSDKRHLTAPDTKANKRIAGALNKLARRYGKIKIGAEKERQIQEVADGISAMWT